MTWLEKLAKRLWYWYESWSTERELKRIRRQHEKKERDRSNRDGKGYNQHTKEQAEEKQSGCKESRET